MKFLINLSVDSVCFGNILPVNYQYELSSYIYRTLTRSNYTYSEWLHQNGFVANSKQFRLFSFSNLLLPNFKIVADRLSINSLKCGLIISFLPEKNTHEFVRGLFKDQQFSIGDQQSKVAFVVSEIEMLAEPDFTVDHQFVTLSPVCITRKETKSNRIIYEMPESDYAKKALLMNLKNKYAAFYEKGFDSNEQFDLKLLSNPHSKLIGIKTNTAQQTRVKGYHFNFALQADPAILHTMYHAGLGEKNAIGFGHIETKENMKRIRERLK
jgi:CRISPR-associated endoribonuclease Cas6